MLFFHRSLQLLSFLMLNKIEAKIFHYVFLEGHTCKSNVSMKCSDIMFDHNVKFARQTCIQTWLHTRLYFSTFSKNRLLPELRQVLSWESPAVCLHFPLEEKGPSGLFHQLWQVLAKGRHLLQILLKALYFRSQRLKKRPIQANSAK